MKFVKVTTTGTWWDVRIVPVPDDYTEQDIDISELSWDEEIYDESREYDCTEWDELSIDEIEKNKHLSRFIERNHPKEYKEFISVPVSDLSKLMNKIYEEEKENRLLGKGDKK